SGGRPEPPPRCAAYGLVVVVEDILIGHRLGIDLQLRNGLGMSIAVRGVELLEVPWHRPPAAVAAMAPVLTRVATHLAWNSEVPVNAPVFPPDIRLELVRSVDICAPAACPTWRAIVEVGILLIMRCSSDCCCVGVHHQFGGLADRCLLGAGEPPVSADHLC